MGKVGVGELALWLYSRFFSCCDKAPVSASSVTSILDLELLIPLIKYIFSVFLLSFLPTLCSILFVCGLYKYEDAVYIVSWDLLIFLKM